LGKLRALLDEDIPDDLKSLFPKKTQVYTVAGLGLSGIEDRLVIEEAVHKKCLIVTANKDFVPEYRDHEWRKGKDGRFFWGLIFLRASKSMTQSDQLKRGIKAINPQYDDIITVSATGHISRERMKGHDLKKETARPAFLKGYPGRTLDRSYCRQNPQ
jgi:predicted nuclease of predicted toxin-antitoxin system